MRRPERFPRRRPCSKTRESARRSPRIRARSWGAGGAGRYLPEGEAPRGRGESRRARHRIRQGGRRPSAAGGSGTGARAGAEGQDDEGGATRNFEGAIDQLKAVDAVYALSDAYAQYSAFLERRGNNKRALEILKQAWQLRERSMATH